MGKTLVLVHEGILMLDGHDLVVADKTQIGDDGAPEIESVAVADRAEDPSAVDLIPEGFGVKNAVDGNVVLVDLGVLCVEVVDRTLKRADGGNGVDALPDQVGGVEVGTDRVTDSGTKAEQGLGVVNAEAGVHFKGDLGNAVLLGESGGLLPIGDEDLVPLICKDLAKVTGPRAGDPVGGLILGRAAGTAREGHDGINAKLLGEKDSVVEIVVKLLCDLGVGVYGIAVAGKASKRHVMTGKRVLELGKLAFVRKQDLGVCVIASGIAAATDFYSLNATFRKIFESLFCGKTAKKICLNTKFHNN